MSGVHQYSRYLEKKTFYFHGLKQYGKTPKWCLRGKKKAKENKITHFYIVYFQEIVLLTGTNVFVV